MVEHNVTLADLEGLDLEDFDPADYIDGNDAAAAYLTAALASNDAAMFASAVGDVARARGMAEVAALSGLTREGLYKALRSNSQPRMETLIRVLDSFGLRLKVEVIPTAERRGVSSHAPAKRPRTSSFAPAKLAATKSSVLKPVATKSTRKKSTESSRLPPASP